MKELTQKWWFWLIFVIIVIVLFITGLTITKIRVDKKYENTTELNKYLKESNQNRQISINEINEKYY